MEATPFDTHSADMQPLVGQTQSSASSSSPVAAGSAHSSVNDAYTPLHSDAVPVFAAAPAADKVSRHRMRVVEGRVLVMGYEVDLGLIDPTDPANQPSAAQKRIEHAAVVNGS